MLGKLVAASQRCFEADSADMRGYYVAAGLQQRRKFSSRSITSLARSICLQKTQDLPQDVAGIKCVLHFFLLLKTVYAQDEHRNSCRF
jgi:hypothetical protein